MFHLLRSGYTYLVFFLLYLFYHLLTLSITPTPWFDESLMASITESLVQDGEFTLKHSEFYDYSHNYYLYGPLYFLCTSSIIKVFGLGVFQYRITAFVFGILCWFVFCRIVKRFINSENNKSYYWFGLLFLSDPVLNTNMHEGRMDTMCIFFIALAFYQFLSFLQSSKNKHLVLIGVFSALALLVTTRAGFIVMLFPLLLLYYVKGRPAKIKANAILGLSLLIVYSPWFFYAFGSIHNFLAYYKSLNDVFSSFSFGLDQNIFTVNYPLFIMGAAAVVYLFFKSKKELLKPVYLPLIIAILIFHLFVKGGFYVIFVIPFYYLLLLRALEEYKAKTKQCILYFFAVFNLVVFSLRAASNLSSDFGIHQQLDEFIAQHIPPDSRVVGEDKFYFSARKNRINYQSAIFWWLTNDEERELYHRNNFNYEYIVKELNSGASWEPYFKNSVFDTVAVFKENKTSNALSRYKQMLGSWFYFNPKVYDCVILKRKQVPVYCSHFPEIYPTKGTSFFVALNGNDGNTGSIQHPFKSMEEALYRIYQLPDSIHEASIVLRKGEYLLKHPIKISSSSKKNKLRLNILAYHNEEVIVSGAKKIKLPQSSNGEALIIDAKKYKLDLGSMTRRSCWKPFLTWPVEIYIGNHRQEIAMWPEKTWLTTNEESVQGEQTIVTPKERFSVNWPHAQNTWLYGYFIWDWGNYFFKVDSLAENKITIRTQTDFTKGQKMKLYNVWDEVDKPGEYAIDFIQQKIKIIPSDEYKGELYLGQLDTLLSISYTSNVVIQGIQFAHSKGCGLYIQHASDIRLNACTIKNMAGIGTEILDCKNISISNCEYTNTGEGGIYVKAGDRKTLSAGHVRIHNNSIHKYDHSINRYRPAISLNGVGNRVDKNRIYDSPHSGIIFDGNDHIIEDNEFHDVCSDKTDAGVIMIHTTDWTKTGNIIRNNYIHDIPSGEGISSVGIYLDGYTSGTQVYGNVLYTADHALLINGGQYNSIHDNVFADGIPAIEVNAPGLTYDADWFNGKITTLDTSYQSHSNSLYFKAYPFLKSLKKDSLIIPLNNKFYNNTFVSTSWKQRATVLFSQSREYDLLNDLNGHPFWIEPGIPAYAVKDSSNTSKPFDLLLYWQYRNEWLKKINDCRKY